MPAKPKRNWWRGVNAFQKLQGGEREMIVVGVWRGGIKSILKNFYWGKVAK